MLFHFANAAMLPLIGQKLALRDSARSSLYLAFCTFGAQLVMIPVAMPRAALRKVWDAKWFIIGFGKACLRLV